MFHKLRLRLALINLGIIALLFLLLIGGSYFLATHEMEKRLEFMPPRLAADVISGKISGSQRGELPPHLFYAKTDEAGAVTKTSNLPPFGYERLQFLVPEALKTVKQKGFISLEENEYFYFKASLPDHQGTLIIFEDITREQNTLHILLATLSVTGIVCLALSLFGSLFMADRAMVPIQTAWQQQKDFLADASHELRTPLAVIQTNLEVVRENQTATVSSQDKWLKNIQEETVCMTKLVNSLLFLAQADSRQQLLVRNDFPLGQMVAAAAETFRPLAASRGITLDVSVETGIRYYGDEPKIRQLIGILLDNAIRHTPPGGKIRVQLEQSKSAVMLIVADSGEGISSEYLAKIFERFYQVDQSRAKGGAGLGLSIAKWIVESHQGTIHAASELGVGTIFSILLPLSGNQTRAV